MSYIEFNSVFPLIDLPQDAQGNYRKAHVINLVWGMDEAKIIVRAEVFPYDKEGNRLDLAENSIYKVADIPIIANPERLVDINTGMPICLVSEEYSVTDAGDKILNPALEKITYARQTDYWNYVAKEVEVKLWDAIVDSVLIHFTT